MGRNLRSSSSPRDNVARVCAGFSWRDFLGEKLRPRRRLGRRFDLGVGLRQLVSFYSNEARHFSSINYRTRNGSSTDFASPRPRARRRRPPWKAPFVHFEPGPFLTSRLRFGGKNARSIAAVRVAPVRARDRDSRRQRQKRREEGPDAADADAGSSRISRRPCSRDGPPSSRRRLRRVIESLRGAGPARGFPEKRPDAESLLIGSV